MPRCLITGITGQDGSHLAELLLAKGYEVHGLVRRASTFNTTRIDHIRDQVTLHDGDLVDSSSLRAVFDRVQPHEVYNLAAQSHVRVSFEMAEYTYYGPARFAGPARDAAHRRAQVLHLARGAADRKDHLCPVDRRRPERGRPGVGCRNRAAFG